MDAVLRSGLCITAGYTHDINIFGTADSALSIIIKDLILVYKRLIIS